ncbi:MULTISPECIES: hypothetical protein [Pandoraea]|uniref:Uncharacterized protein n=2 Tax=Pandoraea TaxID=93217 RepID=A0A5E5PD71_9BURK|nr:MULTISPECIES: hypothetical protein [Pandoraea]OXS92652.1 hypothetical protein B7H01_17090 [Pandoraea apista]RRJ30818.1 hypothetical protein EIB05_13635 [Pandoraea apista]RRJ74555.1 hypothetical protein EIL82_14970 [Pandoraea apista]RSD06410.1 hypothetical protein EJB12_22005 [Pandoraea apista]RSD14562.1 hypothetical protein EIZ52_18180 [Pandoraea apista]
MNELQKLLHLEGQLLATQAAVRALILASNDKYAAMKIVALELDKLTAAALPSTVPEEFVSGIEAARPLLFPSKSDLA